MQAPKTIADKRAAHPLNDTTVTLKAPTARYRAGSTFTQLTVTVWAVHNGLVVGHHDTYGECWAPIENIIEA